MENRHSKLVWLLLLSSKWEWLVLMSKWALRLLLPWLWWLLLLLLWRCYEQSCPSLLHSLLIPQAASWTDSRNTWQLRHTQHIHTHTFVLVLQQFTEHLCNRVQTCANRTQATHFLRNKPATHSIWRELTCRKAAVKHQCLMEQMSATLDWI